MVAAIAVQQPDPKRLHLVTEFRGAVGRLFREHSGEIVISGPAGTGKTRSILEWLNLRCAQEPLRVLFLRKTLESLKTSALVTFTEKVLHDFDGKRSAADGVTYFGGNHIRPSSFTYEQTGSTIVIGGMDNPTKILSTEYDIIYVNECTELTLDEWERLGNRTDRPDTNQSRPASLLLGDCNPDAPRHWIKKRQTEGHLQLWLTTHKDNPAMWDRRGKAWTPSGERYMERLQRLTGVRRQRLLLGVWAASEGQVYTEFNPEQHVRKTVRYPEAGVVAAGEFDVTYCTPYMTVDIGSRNPTAILTAHLRDHDDHLHISREVYRRGMGSTDILTSITDEADRCDPFAIYIDPSAKAYITDLQNMGYPAVAANNDVLVGIQRVHGVLAHGFSIDPECVNTIDEFGEYSYQDNPKIETDKPIKDNDHCLVAGTMVATRHGDMPIEHVSVGTSVLTRGGYRPVVSSGMTSPAAEVYTVTLANGKTIIGTGNHRIWVGARGGWTRIDDLQAGDVLTGRTEVKACASKQPYIGGLRSADIQIQFGRLIGTISGHTAGTLMQECLRSIVRFGATTTETSRKAITSITSTGTRPTTTSPTSHAFPRPIISRFMERNHHPNACVSTWRTFGHWLLNGTALTLAASGIASMDVPYGKPASRSAKCAISAASHSTTSPVGPMHDSAPTIASRHGDARPALMTKIAPAPSAVIPSASTVTPSGRPARLTVLDVTKQPQRQPVFDLTIDGVHEFVANGVLVHNSMDAIRYLCMGVMQDEGDGGDVYDLYRAGSM